MGWVTVNLPKSRVPAFPARCIGCGAADPDGTWRVRTRAIGWLRTFLLQGAGPRFNVDAPACRACRPRLRRGAWARTVGNGVLALAGIGLAVWLLGWQQGFWGTWAVAAVALVTFLPLFVWERAFPPALDLTAYPRTVDYNFRDPGYAEEFRQLNSAEPDWIGPSPVLDRAGTVVAVGLTIALAGLGLLIGGQTVPGIVAAGLGVIVTGVAAAVGLKASSANDGAATRPSGDGDSVQVEPPYTPTDLSKT